MKSWLFPLFDNGTMTKNKTPSSKAQVRFIAGIPLQSDLLRGKNMFPLVEIKFALLDATENKQPAAGFPGRAWSPEAWVAGCWVLPGESAAQSVCWPWTDLKFMVSV